MMLKVLFGDITDGRLQRLPFLGYSVLVTLFFMGTMFAVVMGIVGAEKIVGGDLQQAQAQITQMMGIPFIIFMVLFVSVVFFAQLNLMAKRIRDMGLSGWWLVLALVLLSGLVGGTVSEQAGSGVQMVGYLILLLVPSNTFGRS